MKYFNIGSEFDLSNTSYRALAEKNGLTFIEYNEGEIGVSWEELSEEELVEIFDGVNPFKESIIPEPVLLSDTEEAIHATNANVEYIVCLSELGL